MTAHLTAPRIGWALLALLLGFALLAPLADPLGPFKQSLLKALSGADAAAPFGYDHLGRSLFSRLAHALRLSLLLAFAATATAAALGIALGALASWRGGWIDTLLRSLSDAMLALPGLLIVLIVSAMALGGFWTLYAGLALAQWVEYFRLVRARSRVILSSPHVEAARLLGFGPL